MASYKLNISDPASGKTFKLDVSGHNAQSLLGKKIGDEVDGMNCGLPGFKVTITGGTDGSGFPMRTDFDGNDRRRLLLTRSQCFKPTDYPGKRKRKSVRGNTIGAEIVQVNLKITKRGTKDPAELLGAKTEE